MEYALKGGRILPCLNTINSVEAKMEIFNLSRGNDKEAKGFIGKREDNICKDGPVYKKKLIDENKGKKKPKNYLEMRDDYFYRRQILDHDEFKKLACRISDSMLFPEPEKYPFVNTYINCELYNNYINLIIKDSSFTKNTSDFRHLISSNATDYFITKDEDLKKKIPKICPYLNVKDNI